MWVAQLVAIVGFWMVTPFLPVHVQHLNGMDDGEAARWMGWAGFAAGMAMTVFAPVWGVLADRHGRKLMVLRSMLGGAVVMALMGFAPNAGWIIVCRALQGALTGSVAASVTLVSSITPIEHTGYAIGVLQSAVHIGVLIGPLAGGVVCDRFSFLNSCLVAAAMLLFAGGLVLVGAQEEFKPAEHVAGEDRKSYATMMRSGTFVSAILIVFLVNVSVCVVLPVMQLYVKELVTGGALDGLVSQPLYRVAALLVKRKAGIDPAPESVVNTLTGGLYGFAGVAAALSAAISGRIGDRWNHRRLLILSAVLAGFVTIPHVFAESIGELFLYRMGYGFASAGMVVAANAIIRQVTKDEHVGKAYGLSTSTGALGWAFGPLVGGYMGKYAGLRSPFLFTGVMLVAVGFYVWFVMRPIGNSRQELSPQTAAG